MIAKIRSNPWPYAIIAYFIVFITAMACWITFAVNNEMELERPDYYDHEIRFQAQIDRAARTAALRDDVLVEYQPKQNSVTISLPKAHQGATTNGELYLYRPSDSKLDLRIPLAISESGSQIINVARLQGGLWKLRLSWQALGAEYYFDKSIVLASK